MMEGIEVTDKEVLEKEIQGIVTYVMVGDKNACEARPLVTEWDRTFQNGVTKNAVYPVWIVNSGHQKHHQFPRYRDRHQHISRDITNLTLRFLHQKTATTITPTTSIPHSLKGLIVRNEKDIMVIELCQYLQQRRSPSWFHRYFCVRDFNPIW
eukprot:XP_019918951.1 PREDICTED: uncharacterized protein LOC105318544 [Crassostrea gigas]